MRKLFKLLPVGGGAVAIALLAGCASDAGATESPVVLEAPVVEPTPAPEPQLAPAPVPEPAPEPEPAIRLLSSIFGEIENPGFEDRDVDGFYHIWDSGESSTIARHVLQCVAVGETIQLPAVMETASGDEYVVDNWRVGGGWDHLPSGAITIADDGFTLTAHRTFDTWHNFGFVNCWASGTSSSRHGNIGVGTSWSVNRNVPILVLEDCDNQTLVEQWATGASESQGGMSQP